MERHYWIKRENKVMWSVMKGTSNGRIESLGKYRGKAAAEAVRDCLKRAWKDAKLLRGN